jgi:TPP-dependent 2-oxoacid decarboxylase
MHEIERVIQVALIEKRPVYISVPEVSVTPPWTRDNQRKGYGDGR